MAAEIKRRGSTVRSDITEFLMYTIPESGLMYKDLAEVSGIHRSTISGITLGSWVDIKCSTAEALLEALGYDVYIVKKDRTHTQQMRSKITVNKEEKEEE